ncbi:Phage protein [Lysobacter dokdonensis DS-58]|uniref:Phage protein n=1 Tax=Lysobacter dokdonensis DS-58 TaxID=1300345 RepID=A0A0A2WJA2_9GAMM|nr:HNH endonuclease [Lysobacter dokdonensis]KGQ19903.1 Phage protein [Lysobacter dokdonensis DS-58]
MLLKDATIAQLEAALEAAKLKNRLDEWSIPVPESGCWLWTGCTSGGYGLTSHRNKSVGAHRVSWMVHRGPIPDGAVVCHKCDTPGCINPDHLFLGSHRENMLDKIRKGRQPSNAGERHGMSKLSDADVREIRRRVWAGERQRDVAAAFGVTRGHISYITTSRGWRDVA